MRVDGIDKMTKKYDDRRYFYLWINSMRVCPPIAPSGEMFQDSVNISDISWKDMPGFMNDEFKFSRVVRQAKDKRGKARKSRVVAP